MYVEHPEYSDILVNLDTHRLVYSNDGGNDYTYDFKEKCWCGTEVHMGFKLFSSSSSEEDDGEEVFNLKEYYLNKYCKFDNELNKYVYSYDKEE